MNELKVVAKDAATNFSELVISGIVLDTILPLLSVDRQGNILTNNSSFVDVNINAVPDLTIAKTGSTQVSQGGSATFTLTPQNIGLAATSGVITVKDTLPPGFTPVSASGTGWTCGMGSIL